MSKCKDDESGGLWDFVQSVSMTEEYLPNWHLIFKATTDESFHLFKNFILIFNPGNHKYFPGFFIDGCV